MSKLPYSYHTFLFPFIWDNKKASKDKCEERSKDGGESKNNDLPLNPNKWKEVTRDDILMQKEQDEYRLNYATYQYFTTAARSLVFPEKKDGNEAVHNYIYNLTSQDNSEKSYYYIVKTRTESKEEENSGGRKKEYKITEVFRLFINQIRLKVYNSGVAIILFELENYGDLCIYTVEKDKFKVDHIDIRSVKFKSNENNSLDHINKINEHGRRINLPFIGDKENPCLLTADNIAICIGNQKPIESKFLKAEYNFCSNIKQPGWTHIMDPITKLLGDDFSSDSENKKEKIILYPAVDDRMYVCCLINDEDLCKEIEGSSLEVPSYLKGNNRRLKDGFADETTLALRIYKLLHIENSASCQNSVMRKEILEKCINKRWIDTGTLYGITHHSFICITKKSAEKYVINPFLTQYVEMTCIALAQRATIIALSKEAVEVANGIMEGDLKGLEAIESLQKKYVQAQSQIMLFEVTAQEQGVELFNLLKEQMYINGNKKDLDNQMNNLRDIANIRSNHLERKSDIKLNNILAILSVFGLTLAVLQVAPLFLECYGIVGKVVSCVVAAIVLCLTMFIMIKLGLFNKEKSSGRKNENSASQKEPFYK